MEQICCRLVHLAKELGLSTEYIETVKSVYRDEYTDDILHHMTPEKLHEVIARIFTWPKKKKKLTKFCSRIEPFVIQARIDARCRLTPATVSANTSANEQAADGQYPSADELYAAHENDIKTVLKQFDAKGVDTYLVITRKFDILKRYARYIWECSGKSSHAVVRAAACGDLEVLTWLADNGYKLKKAAALAAVENGHLEVLQFLHGRGLRMTSGILETAVESGYKDVIEWLIPLCEVIPRILYDIAARDDMIYVLNILEKHSPIPDEIPDECIVGGHLNTIRWFRVRGVAFTNDALYHALRIGDREIIEFLIKNGAEWSADAFETAIDHGYKIDVRIDLDSISHD